jgi:cytochrome c biogenesis factor
MAAIAAFAAANAGTISMISTAVSAVGAISQGMAASDQAQSAAQAAQYNATVDQQNANNAMAVANANEESQRRKNAYMLGNTRAGLIQSGIGTDGSSSDVLQQSAQNAELDALNIRYEGILKGRAYSNQENLDVMQANADQNNADNAMTNGFLGAGGALLSGASNYSNQQSRISFDQGRTARYLNG